MSYLYFNKPKKNIVEIPINRKYNLLLIRQFTNYVNASENELAMENKKTEDLRKIINELTRIIDECTEKTQNT